MFVAEAVCFGGELEPKLGDPVWNPGGAEREWGLPGQRELSRGANVGGKSWGWISGFRSRSGGAKRSDQVPARSRSLAEAGSGNPQGSAQARPLLSQGPEGERTPHASVRVTGPY